jgi:hypothetical protein
MRRITEHWSVGVDDSFQRRVEDGSLVFWRPGQTVWINCWGNGRTPTRREAIALIKEEASPERKDLFEDEDGAVYRYGYLLVERNGRKKQYAVYAFAVVEGEYVQLAAYFDKPADQSWAEAVARSPAFQVS